MNDPSGGTGSEGDHAGTSRASAVRALIRSRDRATLATLSRQPEGGPYASLVLLASGHDGAPILHLSDLAEHSRNITADARVSLLVDGTAGLDDPLTGSRASLVGTVDVTRDAGLIARYLARHPSARAYAGFADFKFYRMQVSRAHLVAGFGKIDWVEGQAIRFAAGGAEALARSEADIVAHMNQDHGDAVALYATRLLNLPPGDWVMTGIDPEGIDLRDGGRVARLDFDQPVHDAETARAALVRLVAQARGARRAAD